MMTTTQSIKLYTFGYKELRTYLFAALFVVGNILLPQLCHLLPQGGLTWLPIYFFTLVAAYKYGWKVGLLTAVASPVINNLLFGMPGAAMLPIILVKSALIVAAATVAAPASAHEEEQENDYNPEAAAVIVSAEHFMTLSPRYVISPARPRAGGEAAVIVGLDARSRAV